MLNDPVTTQPLCPTIQSELEETYKLLGLIEDRLFFPCPVLIKEKETVYSGNKIIDTRNEITVINERLSKIYEGLNCLGK